MSGFVPFQALMASAGSGKTFSLVVRYLSLLFMGEKPEEILALTFTNKAAGEMQERIVETLTDLPRRDELAAIAEVCGMTREAILAKQSAVLQSVLRADTKVMTIDSFLAKVLRKFALHAGIMPDFGTYEAQHALKVTARFLRLCEIEGKESTLVSMALLSSKRLADIFGLLDSLYARGPELKGFSFEAEGTAAHEAKATALYRELLATFEGKPLSARAQKALQAENIDDLAGKTWITKESLEYWDFKKHFEPEMDRLLRQLRTAVADYMRAKERQFFAHLFELLDLYKSAKLTVAKEDSELGFDDITILVHYLLRERVEREFLYFRLDSRISHLLLDEFQDTSVIQFGILKPLVDEMVSGSGVREHHSFFIVGDVKQSIYRFRGGTRALFGAVTEAYGLRVDSLRVNWRSSRSVVAFVNTVFDGRIEGYEPQEVKPGASQGYVEVVESEAVLEATAETVKRLLERGAAPGSIAVLTATNRDGEAVQESLSALGIDVVTETTSKLISQKRVRALIDYLKYCYFGETIYARSFFALSDLPPRPLERRRIERGGLVDALRQVMERFGLFEGDLNVIRFLEAAARYEDIEAFLFEYERLDVKAVNSDSAGVRVLTVHKSKGLEYPYVIVLDRLGKKHADTAPILYDYDGIALQGLFLRQKNRARFDETYARALEREAALAREDEMNALYVAFTRARENLYIIRKPKDSKFEMLDLAPMTLGEERIEKAETTGTAAQKAPEYVPLRLGRQSEVVTAEKEAEPEDHAAVTYGLALHYTLEMMESFTPAALHDAMTATANRYGALTGEPALASIEERIRKLLENEAFAALCAGEVSKEQPITWRGELRYLDLLVRHEGHWVVIDYKSARGREADHRAQVGFYIEALREITGEPVRGYLCYLLETGVEMAEVTVDG